MEFKGLKREYELIGAEITDHIQKVIASGNFISGDDVVQLESKLADYVGVRHCISCANATDGLILALMAIGLSHGDVVFVPDFSYIASASSVSILGGTPVFVDIQKDTFNMSPVSLEDAIRGAIEANYKCKAIIAVDLFGLPADYMEIRKIADRYNLPIIEDGAQGFGGKFENQRACSFGDIGVTSFFPAKPLGAYGDGGAIFTDNDILADKIWSLRNHGRSKSDKYYSTCIGFNSRLDTIQAAVLLEKFKIFDDMELTAVNRVADLYISGLSNIVETPKVPARFYSSWAQYTIMLRSSHERSLLKEYLFSRNIPSCIYYDRPLHMQPALKNAKVIVDLKWSQYASERVLSLPIHAFMKKEELGLVINTVKSFFGEQR